MRWTRNDTAAYDAVSRAGSSVLDAYDKYQLGRAYGQGGGSSREHPSRRKAD